MAPQFRPLVFISSWLLLFSTLVVDARNLNITEDGKLHGEGNYADFKIFYHSGSPVLTVKKPWLKWGKWVPGKGNYHNEISSPNGMTMTAWGEYHIASAGRENSPSGTEASVDLYSGDERVLYLYWDVSWGARALWKNRQFSDKFNISFVRIGESYLLITVYISAVEGVEVV